MQAGGTVQGASTIHPRRRINEVLAIAAILVIAALVALAVWVVPLATSGVETEDAIPKAGAVPAIVHDDAGNISPGAGSADFVDDAGNVRHY